MKIMKKRMFSVLILFAMLLSVAAVSTVGTSATSSLGTPARTAVYATTKPTIDGVKDPIYTTATAILVNTASRCTLQMLWDEDGIYLFAEVKSSSLTSVDIYISGIAYTMNTATSWWSNSDGSAYRGDYYFELKSAGTLASPAGMSKYVVPDGFDYQTVTTDIGFNAECYIPMKSTDWNIGNGAGNSFIGFGSMVGRNWNWVSGFTAGGYPTPYGMNALRLDANPCTHGSTVYTQTLAPTCTTAGSESGVCPVCGKELTRSVDALGHDFAQTPTVDTEPTLTAAGSQSRHCSRCDETTDESVIEKTTIQLLGVQTTEVADGSYDVRFVAQIAGLEAFSAVGYDVSLSYGQTLDAMSEAITKELKSSSVYTSIQAGDTTETPRDGGVYLAAIAVTDIPVSEDVVYVSFVIRPFTVSALGEKVYATGTGYRTVVLQSGMIME